jgi:hypothetical protein
MHGSLETKPLGISAKRGDYVSNNVIERHSQLGRATDDVVTVHSASERFVFHFFFTPRDLLVSVHFGIRLKERALE